VKTAHFIGPLLFFGCRSVENTEEQSAEPPAQTPEKAIEAPVKAAAPGHETVLQALGPLPGAERVLLMHPNARIEFTGAKITGTEPGSFEHVIGQIDFYPGNVTASRIAVIARTESIRTDKPRLTEHLKSEDFLDATRYPHIEFLSSRIEPAGPGSYTITGTLNLHGRHKEIRVPVQLETSESQISVRGAFVINRHDFGIDYPGMPDDLIRDSVEIRLTMIATRTARPTVPAPSRATQ
jgi:polyisoprenoid-binding protein YceI